MLLTLLILAATADAADLPTYRCAATTQPIVIDGKLDDAAWSTAQWSGDFTNLYGRGAPARPVPPRTRAKFLFDDRCLYLAAEITETDVRAEMKTHDSPLYRENAFELFIDPDDNGQNYLEFEINARNTTFDLLMSKPYSERGKPDEAWEIADMRTAVHVDGTLNDPRDADNNWTVEIAIPWTAMKELTRDALPPKPGARFRLNMARVMVPPPDIGGKTRYVTWSPINEASLHVPPRWGWLEFAGASARTPGRASTQPAPKSP